MDTYMFYASNKDVIVSYNMFLVPLNILRLLACLANCNNSNFHKYYAVVVMMVEFGDGNWKKFLKQTNILKVIWLLGYYTYHFFELL